MLVLVAFLTACSSTRFIYTLVEKFIEEEIKYFIDLDEEEEALMNQQVSEMVNWHRTSMLPIYAIYLTNLADKLEVGQYSDDDITISLTNGRSLIEETVIGLTPYASKFINRHQKVEEVDFMQNRMLKRQQERLVELSKSEDIQYKKRLERLKSNFQRFLGDLNDSQILLLEAYSHETLGDSRTRLQNRTLRQKVFIRFLRTQPTKEELTAYLNKLLLRGHLIINPTHEAFSKTSLERFRLLLVNILRISSTTQREKLISKLRDYAEEFKAVSG